jgi:phosphoglycerate dehydrogenase-like enzyme
MQQTSPNRVPEQAVFSSHGSETEVFKHRILVAISSGDRAQFFPTGIPMESLPLNWRIADDSELEGPAWGCLLEDFKPTIILCGWSTPRFDSSIINRSWFKPDYICNLTGSVRKILPPELVDRGLLVTNWGTLVASAVAEHALLLVLACARNLVQWGPVMHLPAKEQKVGASLLRTLTIEGMRVGIHGCGSIARETARRLKPFGVSISAYSEGVPSSVFRECDFLEASSLESLFSQSDILIECEALTEKSRGTVTAEILACLPDDSIFVNVGRGAVVDESALGRMAKEGRLRVGLDVYEKEHLPHDSLLLKAPNVLLSPHIAGPTSDLYANCGCYALDNIKRFLNAEPLEAIVDKEVYNLST